MSTEIKTVMLLGAGGNVGEKVLEAFQGSSFTTSVLTRPNSTSTFPSSINVVKSEYTLDDLTRAFKGQDAVVSMVASATVGEQFQIVDAAIAAGVKRFIPSDFGSDTSNARVRELVPIFNYKRAVVERLMENQDKISWTAIISGPFYDWCLQVGFLGIDLKTKKATLIDDGNAPFVTTTLASVGKSVVGALTHADDTKNQYVFIGSFVTSLRQTLDLVEKITGSKFEVSGQSSKEMIETNMEKFKANDFSSIMPLIQAQAFGEEATGDYTPYAKLWNERLSLPKEDMEEVTKKVISGSA